MDDNKRRIGIVGYGKLGQFLAHDILQNNKYELAFVWNRNPHGIGDEIPASCVLRDLSKFREYAPDLIVEVAHPIITHKWGEQFLSYCDYMAGSPTAFAVEETEIAMRKSAAINNGNGLYIPRGALPGLEEVIRMKDAGKLAGATITMRKHPSSVKYSGPMEDITSENKTIVLYDGPLRPLCTFAPNNVNTMAVLALSSEIGFDNVHARLIGNTELEHHITEVELLGPDGSGPQYSLSPIH
jgi:aspartate dehydrogenase